MKKQLSLILLSSLFIVPACDPSEEVDLDDNSTFRLGYKGIKVKQHSTSFKSPGTENPEDPSPSPGWPLQHEMELAAVIRSADAIYASAFASSRDAEELCSDACAGEKLDWSGEVSALGEYAVGEIVWTESEVGRDYVAEIRAEVDVNCLCFEE